MTKTTFNIQDQYLNQGRKERVRVIVTMMSGEKVEGYLKSFDRFCVLIENGSVILLYKHAISTVTSANGTFRLPGGRDLTASLSAGDKRVLSLHDPTYQREENLMRVRDPVCETAIARNKAAAVVRYHGRLHYFCGKSCRMKFIQNPRRYLETAKSIPCPGLLPSTS